MSFSALTLLAGLCRLQKQSSKWPTICRVGHWTLLTVSRVVLCSVHWRHFTSCIHRPSTNSSSIVSAPGNRDDDRAGTNELAPSRPEH